MTFDTRLFYILIIGIFAGFVLTQLAYNRSDIRVIQLEIQKRNYVAETPPVQINPNHHKDKILQMAKRKRSKLYNYFHFTINGLPFKSTDKLNSKQGRQNFWHKLQAAFKHIYQFHFNKSA